VQLAVVKTPPQSNHRREAHMKVPNTISSLAMKAKWALVAPDHWKFAERRLGEDIWSDSIEVSNAALGGTPSEATMAMARELEHCPDCVRKAYQEFAVGFREAFVFDHATKTATERRSGTAYGGPA
jgi:hypothetical protein